ncbi:MAG: acetyltransferase [Saccharofermentans sp.]|nr:acetyltransferase [Saccharofermentans sp.]
MEEKNYFVHESAYVDDNVKIGSGTKVWHFCHIQSGAVIGEKCSLGQNVNISKDVTIGNGVKIQNNVSVYEGVTLEDCVFCGPSCVFTNDLTPRARYPKGSAGYKKTVVHHDATIGANATIVCNHEIGEFATIAAGAVVTKNVIPHALMAGVPARQIGWVCECGQVLDPDLKCPDCGRQFKIEDGRLV